MTLLNDTLKAIVPQDGSFRTKAKEHLDQLTMPHWALGRLLDLAVDLAGMTRSLHPAVDKRVVVVMAGDHGVVADGVSQYPQEVTCQMILNFLRGGAGINAVAQSVRRRGDSGKYGDCRLSRGKRGNEETDFASRRARHEEYAQRTGDEPRGGDSLNRDRHRIGLESRLFV